MQVSERHLRRYVELFCHRRDIYAVQRQDGSYFLAHEPITAELLGQHLEGTLTCGWYALKHDNTVRWVTLDADEADGLSALQQVWQRLDQLGLVAHLEDSRRGGHLWVFVEPVRASVVRTLMGLVLERLEIDDVEVYPRQSELAPGGVGSLVRGPLGVHRLTGERYPFLDPAQLTSVGGTLKEQLSYLVGCEVNTVHQVAEALAELVSEPRQASGETDDEATFEHDKVAEVSATI